jgi:hypothetical protein
MAADFGCFKLRARTPGGEDALLAYALSPRDAAAVDAWPLLTGRLANPRGHNPAMFSENDRPEHRAVVRRIIRSHQIFGSEDLLLWFDWQHQLLRVEDPACREVLWRSVDDGPPPEENVVRPPVDPPVRLFLDRRDVAEGIVRRVS